MNIKDQHDPVKPVSAKKVFEGTSGEVKAIQVLAGKTLKEHITKIPACLFCVEGHIIFENEQGLKESLKPGDYMLIEPMVLHWLYGVADSHLILVR
jgi:quercetin dioxygenase-like cupin family protein